MGKYFGTDGIRGEFGSELVNVAFARRMGSALGRFLTDRKPEQSIQAVIGRDTRISGQVLVDAMIQGLTLQNVYVRDLGIVPTPAVALVLREQHADLGIAVTASHNPAADNGIKLFDATGFKFTEAEEAEIEKYIDETGEVKESEAFSRSYPLDGAALYINHLRSLMHQNFIADWTIVLDTANGATCETTPAVFGQWGANLIRIGDNPDGENINQGVGSEYPDALSAAVIENKAQLGIAHDGDGDRLVVVDDKGKLVDGDILLGLFGLYALRSGSLRNNTLVATVQSNLGLDHALQAEGGRVERVAVGDRNVAAKMRETGSNVGGESSGHLIFSDFATTGDGLLAAMKLIDLISATRKPLSELRGEVELFPLATLSIKVGEKLPIETLGDLKKAISDAEAELGNEGRVLVRYSGTEPKIRLLVEGRDAERVGALLKALAKAVEKNLSVIRS